MRRSGGGRWSGRVRGGRRRPRSRLQPPQRWSRTRLRRGSARDGVVRVVLLCAGGGRVCLQRVLLWHKGVQCDARNENATEWDACSGTKEWDAYHPFATEAGACAAEQEAVETDAPDGASPYTDKDRRIGRGGRTEAPQDDPRHPPAPKEERCASSLAARGGT